MNDDKFPSPGNTQAKIQTTSRIVRTGGSSVGFGVAASPFNAVKLELAIILILGIVLGLLVDSITQRYGIQIVLLMGYGIAASVWLWLRTRRVLVRELTQRESFSTPVSDTTRSDTENTPSV